MGLKTYAQLQVVKSPIEISATMCGIDGVNVCEGMIGFCKCIELNSNGTAVLIPINGVIGSDKMIVESLLSDVVSDNNFNFDSHSISTCFESDAEHKENSIHEENIQLKCAIENLSKALEEEEEEIKSSLVNESLPLLNEKSVQIYHVNGKPLLFSRQPCQSKNERHQEYSENMYSVSKRLECNEHVSNNGVDQVIDNVIYTEREYSSSDMSTAGNSSTPKPQLKQCRHILSRTNNGTDHTVYELGPSDSSYSSADNLETAIKSSNISDNNDGLCQIWRSLSSRNYNQNVCQSQATEASMSITKPLVVQSPTENTNSKKKNMQNFEHEPKITDADPLVTHHVQPASSEAVLSNIMLEDTRSHYNRKAADRGTLYCACSGITVVATIVFLLIYFS